MKNAFFKGAEGNSGFTLLEMLVVIAVLGILMSVSLPNLTGVIETAEVTGIKMELQQARADIEAVLTDRNYWELRKDSDFSEGADFEFLDSMDDIEFAWESEDDENYILTHQEEIGEKKLRYKSSTDEFDLDD
ncbi:type II secretion system protein [Halarsenatibacter silvermanii]|uniref:General secretion pathway protein G n=1 Tax=Halarsenatibacter silvermanii TaxID=321763 RepID=A0A1G9JZV9_9FIRM|nr:prepilin-type N-terminal cleavage/methylation domain-containing protein [Halarsenatibacter silvermanii]SDL42972.1 general secretion pathway protein G [Halarsenatibacter silvermanii]